MGSGVIRAHVSQMVGVRRYRRYHADARINFVTYRGRTVWMTQKQFSIWRVIQDYRLRNRRVTMKVIADKSGVSVASVSRFLRRLDLWRFLDLATWTGRKGGTWIRSRRAPITTMERDAWLAGARHTWASRKRARDLLLQRLRRRWERDAHPPRPARTSSTDAKFRPFEGVQLRLEGLPS